MSREQKTSILPGSHSTSTTVVFSLDQNKGGKTRTSKLCINLLKALNELWQSLSNNNALQVLRGLPGKRRHHEKVMELFKRTVMRVLSH